METSENPYASPTEALGGGLSTEEVRQLDQDLAIARRETRFPAMGLLLCSLASGMLVSCTTSFATQLGILGLETPWLSRHIVDYWYLYLVPFSIYFLASFFGALSLLKCQNRVLAKVGCYFSLAPLVHPLFPLAIPFAIHGLVVLRRPRVDLAFRRAELDERSDRTRALAKLFSPACILLMLSCLTLSAVVAPFLINVVVYPSLNPEGAEAFMQVVKTKAAPRVLAVASGAIFVGYAAIQMLRGRQYWVCVAGAIMAIIPLLSPCIFFGLPFGIWALVILLQRDTRAAFAEAE